ncbi:hypothetical protein ACO0LD_19705 [Undibacterium sp. Ji83W]|uniref:hypothetical protein n=1 Tax=Undibacterium sp. Ji83W TaxID=3413043 RepID=UPI003BF0F7A7
MRKLAPLATLKQMLPKYISIVSKVFTSDAGKSMIYLHKLIFLSGLDLNVEAQNWDFLQILAEGSYASAQTRFPAGHNVFAADHLSTIRRSPEGRTQEMQVTRHHPPGVSIQTMDETSRAQPD